MPDKVAIYFPKIVNTRVEYTKKTGAIVTLETPRVLKCCVIVERQSARSFRQGNILKYKTHNQATMPKKKNTVSLTATATKSF
jgi:hypothetical protein